MKIVFDTETTGLPIFKNTIGNAFHDPKELEYYDRSRLVEISLFKLDDQNNITNKFTKIIRPTNVELKNNFCENIHGITYDYAIANGEDLQDVLKQVYEFINDCDTLIAHNILFDNNILLSECYRLNYEELITKMETMNLVCTKELGKIKMNNYKFPKLIELFNYLYPNDNTIQHHRAESDTLMCYKCYLKMVL